MAACAQCGANVPEGSGFCPVCGAATAGAAGPPPGPQQTSQFGTQPQYGTPPATGAAPSVSLDISRLTWADILFTAGSLLVFISYFLSWYTATVSGYGSGSESLSGAGGWRVIILLLAIVAVIYGALKILGFSAKIPVPTWQVMAGIGGLQFLLLLIAFLAKPSVGLSGGLGVSVSWAYGAFLGLIFGIAVLVGVYLEKVGAPLVSKGGSRSAGGAGGPAGGGWG